MRQFILGKKVAYASGSSLADVADGSVGFFYNKDGVLTVSSDGSDLKDEFMLVLGRSNSKGGPVVIPVYKNKFRYAKGVYEASTTFSGTVTVTAPTQVGDYSVIVVLKGVKFNERNKWTAMVHVTDTTMTAADLAEKLAAQINLNSVGSGVTATAASGVITVTASKAGVDYTLLGADLLTGATVKVTTVGMKAFADAAYVQDLANKAAADAGIEYTYREAGVQMYPNYPLNPLAGEDSDDAGFTVFTLQFAEPRKVVTRDEVVNQIVQVAFPTGASAISTFETVCEALV